MREKTGLTGRVPSQLKAAILALLAIFAVSAVGASSASAAQKLELEFNDAWIKVDSLAALTGGGMQALDPSDADSPKISLKAPYNAKDGTFSGTVSDFSFPDTVIPVNSMGFSDIVLGISAASAFNGTYDATSGAINTVLPLRLSVLGKDQTTNQPKLSCEISPMNINLSTSGSSMDFGSEEEPAVKAPAAFTGGNGALLGSWTGVKLDSVKGVAIDGVATADEMTEGCQAIIGILMGSDPDASFDGSIWLGGTAAVTGQPDPEVCPQGQVGTPPDCKVPVTNGKVGKLTATPKKGKVKRGKVAKVKVKITNSGGKVLKTKIKVKSSNKKVKAPKTISVSVKPGKTVTKTVKVKAAKKAKGKAKITFSAGGKKAVATLTVKK